MRVVLSSRHTLSLPPHLSFDGRFLWTRLLLDSERKPKGLSLFLSSVFFLCFFWCSPPRCSELSYSIFPFSFYLLSVRHFFHSPSFLFVALCLFIAFFCCLLSFSFLVLFFELSLSLSLPPPSPLSLSLPPLSPPYPVCFLSLSSHPSARTRCFHIQQCLLTGSFLWTATRPSP